MNRPETHTDLPVDEHWEVVADFNVAALAVWPELLGIYAQFVAEVKDCSGRVDTEQYDRSRVKASLPVTADQLDNRLVVAQAAWDNGKMDYDAIVAGEDLVDWRQSRARRWANAEGLEPPQPPPAEVESPVTELHVRVVDGPPVRDLCAELGKSVEIPLDL